MNQNASASSKPIVLSLAWDIALNASIPTACYFVSKRFVSSSEVTALLIATTYPALKSVCDLLRQRELNPVTVTVLAGIVAGLFALLLGGNPRMLLIRESIFTGAFGIFCLASLGFQRPLMFYFGRYFIAGKDPAGRAAFEARARNPTSRRGLQLVTGVWGVLYVGEFAIRVILVYTLPAPLVLSISPFMIGTVTILAVIWTFRYRRKLVESQGLNL
ncbi:MAG TPA: VC0807 family protein [Steroidobacteraceae bacterium]|nr:VC0807 family protein [Steroidobacteraceae bacterium]